MPKPKIPNQRKAQLEHKKRVEGYAALIQKVYDSIASEAARYASLAGAEENMAFSFADYPLTKEAIKKLQSQLVNEVSSIIMSGTSDEWKESNLVQDLVAKKLLKAYTGTTKAGKEYSRYFETNPDSLKAFQQRKDRGMNLSTRVWDLSAQYKYELEEAITAAIEPGTSAMRLAAQVKQYLKYPDKRFRRIKEKLSDGTIKWHLSKNAKAFHPGEGKPGVYRSSARNAQRLARTEINMAYRTAEQKRWEQFDFVVGYEVKTTQNGHHVEDICDTLAGKYPKTFKFMGWHPQCMCYSIPILKTEDEFWADNDVKSVNEVTDVPQGFKEWIRDNEERINAAEKRGSLPYFIRDNQNEVEYILSHEKASIKAGVSLNRIHEDGWNLAIRNQGKTVKLLKNDESVLDDVLMLAWEKSPFSRFDAIALRNELLDEFNRHKEIQEPINFNLFWDRDNNMLRVMIKSQGMDIKRKIYIENGKLIANHEIFDLSKSLQGKGLSKPVLSSFLSKYEAMGVERIELMANYSVGGYAWAKYGFTASKEGPFGVLNVINNSGVSDKFKSEALEIVNRYYSSHKADSRFPMNLLCGKEWSKDMLLGSAWQGELNIGDSDVLLGFKERLKMPQKKRKPQDIAAERHAARTEADVDKIRTDWSNRKVNILWDAVNNGLLPSECSSKIAEMKDDILFGDFDVFNRKYQTLNNAIIRHSKRSAGDMQEIQDRWDAKLARDEKTLRDANRVLKQAYKWSEVDYSTLEQLIAENNLTALNKETRRVMDALKDMRAQERALSDLIPDVHGWHNQFGMSELKEAYRSIESTLDYWRSKGMNLSTDSDLKTLKTELDKKIKFVENPGVYKYGAIQKPYWQVLQDSYIKYLDKVDERIWWVDTKSDAYSLITKISSVNSKLGDHWKGEVDWAVNNSNKSYLKTCLTKLDKWDKIIELESQLKTSGVNIVALQKYIKGGNINKAWAEYNKLISSAPSTSPFASSSYVLARKSVALNFDNFTDADNFFYDNAKQNYLKAPKETKKAIDRYTANSSPQTRFARALPSWCEAEYSYAERSLRDHNSMIKYISNSSFSKDVFIYRDEIPDFTVLKTGGLHIFELEKNIKSFSSKITAKYSGILSSTEIQDKINRYIQHEANQLIGKTGVENTVLSTASHSQSFFSGTTSSMAPEQLSCNRIPKVRLKIYCPQGTQAVYAHPYNTYTYKSTGPDGFWDGSKGYGSGENEIFLQSGTQFRVVKAEYWPKGKGSSYEEDRWHIEVEVIGQNPLEIKDIETILGQGRQRGKTVYVPKY